jgi:hypothetical protein
LLIVLSSCDKIEPPFEKLNNNNPDTTKYQRNILVEDFTGFKCGNCPYGHFKLDSLKEIYGSKLISFAVHAGYYAKPDNSGNFIKDYRTQIGDDLDTKFNISALGLPQGMVNRSLINDSRALSPDQWGEIIKNELSQKPAVDIQMVNNFNTATLALGCSVFIQTLDTINQPLVLSVYLVEDSIIDWQRDYNPSEHDIPNYVHRNMLRDALNGSFGTDLLNTALPKGQIIFKSFSYTINSEWKYKNIYTIAFIYNKNSYYILQSQKAKIY